MLMLTDIERAGETSHGFKFSWRNDDDSYRQDTLTFDKSGEVYFLKNVGIGTTSPSSKLEVQGSLKITNPGNNNVLLDLGTDRNWQFRQLGAGSGSALELLSVGGGGNKNFIINTRGSVGIGTANPNCKLEVKGDIKAYRVFIESKPIVFKNYNLTKNPGKYTSFRDTNFHVKDWHAAIVGFDAGVADLQEDGSGTALRVKMTKSGNGNSAKWRVEAALRTHNNLPEWNVDVMFVRKDIAG